MNLTGREWQVVVLTGGGSRRMGRDKATLDVAGASLLDRTLRGVPAEVAVVVAGPAVTVDRGGVRFVQEDPPGGGPVAGLDAALPLVTAPVVVVLATDLPLIGALPEALASGLVGEGPAVDADAVLAEDVSGRPQQLCAAYRTEALRRAIAEAGPAAGAAMRDVVARLQMSTVRVPAASPVGAVDPTWDIDTPEDVQRLAELLAQTRPDPKEDAMDTWVDALTNALELPSAVDTETVLDVARDVAHNVERPAAPVTTYLVGVAVGGGMDPAVAVERVRALVQGWSADS